mgnify:CR=1 FL=1
MPIDPLLKQVNPPPRLMMGPGPVNADPRVQRAMAADLLGQYDPAMTEYMNEVMALYREIFQANYHWTFLIDGTSRAAIESALVSIIEPGDKTLVPVFGRFGHLLTEIASRCGAEVIPLHKEWGEVYTAEEIGAALDEHKPKVLAICQGDTSTTMLQPLEEIGKLCAERGVLSYVDATASIAGNVLDIEDWEIDICTAGLQKCLGGPSGSGPITISDRAAEVIKSRWHVEKGIEPVGFVPGEGSRIQSNYLDLAMIMAYWSPERLNHHTEATSMLYCARECARCVLEEGLDKSIARHEIGSRAMVAGLKALGLELFGDQKNKMSNVTGVYIPKEVDGEAVRRDMLLHFGVEIGTSFGPLHGKIWRLGAMGYNARKDTILRVLNALDSCLRLHGRYLTWEDPAIAALEVYKESEQDVPNIEISPVSNSK